MASISSLEMNVSSLVSHLEMNLSSLFSQITDLEKKRWFLIQNVDIFFLVIMSIIIYFMQCGFAFLECGAVRNKNTTSILIKNFMQSFIAALAYWLIGYPLAYGNGNWFCGTIYWAHHNLPETELANWFFQFVFAANAATIISGAMAERCEIVAYMAISTLMSGFLYPVVTHWGWSEQGWLKHGFEYCCKCPDVNLTLPCDQKYRVKFQDFAGSSMVHLVGGTAAFMGAAFLGPRRGRFNEHGLPQPIKGHSVSLAALGGFILFFGFFAFNGGSRRSISNPGDGAAVSAACINTIISGTFGAFVCLLFTRIYSQLTSKHRYWSLLQTLNGGLAGMVAICASADVVHTWAAAVIGLVAGCSYLLWSRIVVKLKVDDPVDAAAVHAGGGLWGILARPLLAPTGILYLWNVESGLHFAWSLTGAAVIILWSASLSTILFATLRRFGLLRVSSEIENEGLDMRVHGEPAYPVASYGDGWTTGDDLDIKTTHMVVDLHSLESVTQYFEHAEVEAYVRRRERMRVAESPPAQGPSESRL